MPTALLGLYGVSADPASVLMFRFFGAALVQLGLVLYLIRDVGDLRTKRGVVIGSFIGSVAGLVVALTGQFCYTRWDTSSVVVVPLESVARLERSIGRRSNAGRGAMLGALIGGGFGLFLGIAASTDNSGWWEVGPEEIAAATAVAGVRF